MLSAMLKFILEGEIFVYAFEIYFDTTSCATGSDCTMLLGKILLVTD
jgi:hypothetical protein